MHIFKHIWVKIIYNIPDIHHPGLTIMNIFQNLFYLLPALDKKVAKVFWNILDTTHYFAHNNLVCISKLIRIFVFINVMILWGLKY